MTHGCHTEGYALCAAKVNPASDRLTIHKHIHRMKWAHPSQACLCPALAFWPRKIGYSLSNHCLQTFRQHCALLLHHRKIKGSFFRLALDKLFSA